MSGSRRLQRSVRLTVASSLLLLSAVIVAVAVAASSWGGAAAVLSVIAGVVAVRMVYAEVVSTRRHAAIDRAAQARAFGADLARKRREHTAFTQAMTAKVEGQQRTIASLEGTIRLADKRADEAETRVRREARRANEAQARLSSLLDEVLMHRTLPVADANVTSAEEDELFDQTDLPTIINLLAWEDHANAAVVEDLRRQA